MRCNVSFCPCEHSTTIATEVDNLLTFHTGMTVVTVVGGTNINQDKEG